MDISAVISSLSTSGAQWYQLVSTPGSYNPNIPAFQPSSTGAYQAQTTTKALESGTSLLFVGLLVVGAIFVVKALK